MLRIEKLRSIVCKFDELFVGLMIAWFRGTLIEYLRPALEFSIVVLAKVSWFDREFSFCYHHEGSCSKTDECTINKCNKESFNAIDNFAPVRSPLNDQEVVWHSGNAAVYTVMTCVFVGCSQGAVKYIRCVSRLTVRALLTIVISHHSPVSTVVAFLEVRVLVIQYASLVTDLSTQYTIIKPMPSFDLRDLLLLKRR